MRFIPTRTHGILDYLVGIILIAAPWILGFADGDAKQWVPVIVGALIIGQSLITDYELSVAKIIPMGTHLAMDIVAGLFLAASPWLFGFADDIWWPHVLFGLLDVGAALMTQTHPSYDDSAPREHVENNVV
jgi:hypothetical protein